ncbi:MAG: asparagine synthase (glutamine-hydrolyzing) [Planctomycetes bacterium]|nr:asparagine synthase (glutamine-hydrolyzing) [Planctomycetota bacterium]
MCGFAGILTSDAALDPSGRTLERMAASLRHRGPEASGFHRDPACRLAHRRLSIIDLSAAGRQPMANEDGTVWLACNGEIYNFRDLRTQFGLDGKHCFRSRTDTEVLLHLYEEKGIDCVKQLNGMYAFALWDTRTRTLYLARDPFGVKPLFYLRHGGAFYFGSEIKALLAVPGFQPRPSLEALHHFLAFDYVPGALTAFEGISELRPGHVMSLGPTDGEPRLERFYDLEYEIDAHLGETQAVERSRALLTQAVQRQLVADVPVGVMLSGGIDSSALTALMARVRGDADFHTFSLAFDEPSFDESSYARLVARHIGTKHHEIRVTPRQVQDLLPTCLGCIDEPYADGSAIPTYLLAQCARQFVTVLLSGEGGDEFFAGYDTHAAYRVRQLYRRIPPGLRQGLIRPLVDRLPVSHRRLSLDFKAKRFVRGAELDIPQSHFYWRVVLSEEAKRLVLAEPQRFQQYAPSHQFFSDAYARCEAQDTLNRLLYIDCSYHLPDDLMIKNDRMTMAHSLEARVPFTDTDLVTFLATVPVAYKMPGLRRKHLLRSALKGLLPDAVLKKKKLGLEMPYSRWLRAELRGVGEAVLSDSRLRATGIFNPAGVRKLWDEHQALHTDHGRALWGLINYLLWHELYIEKRSDTPCGSAC